MLKVSIFGVFSKSVSFSTESSEKPTIYDFSFFITIYFPKNDNKHPSEMRN